MNRPFCNTLFDELRRAISWRTLFWGISCPLNNTSTCSGWMKCFLIYLIIIPHSGPVRFFRSCHFLKCLSYCDLLRSVLVFMGLYRDGANTLQQKRNALSYARQSHWAISPNTSSRSLHDGVPMFSHRCCRSWQCYSFCTTRHKIKVKRVGSEKYAED